LLAFHGAARCLLLPAHFSLQALNMSCRSFCPAHANRVDANAFIERFPEAEHFVGLIGLAMMNTAKCSMLS
jgi:hypothetical protein